MRGKVVGNELGKADEVNVLHVHHVQQPAEVFGLAHGLRRRAGAAGAVAQRNGGGPLQHQAAERKVAFDFADRGLAVAGQVLVVAGAEQGAQRLAGMRDELDPGQQDGSAVGRFQEGRLQGFDIAAGRQQ